FTAHCSHRAGRPVCDDADDRGPCTGAEWRSGGGGRCGKRGVGREITAAARAVTAGGDAFGRSAVGLASIPGPSRVLSAANLVVLHSGEEREQLVGAIVT